MAFKDRFDKLISYFDTDEVSDVEDTMEDDVNQEPQQTRSASQSSQTQVRQEQQERQPRAQVQQASTPRSASSQNYQAPRQQQAPRQATEDNRTVRPLPQRREPQAPPRPEQTTTIALKYPRKYEDAQEIVDLLIVNECVLIDFQYMLDAQARRCLDFIDGASRVLYGTLQKVGSSMYLLTPSNVIVDIEELNILHNNDVRDHGFDFDMKRR